MAYNESIEETKKITVSVMHGELLTKSLRLEEIDSELAQLESEFLENKKKLEKEKKKIFTEVKNIHKRIPKLLLNELNKASKKKTPRKGMSGGINKKKPVPKKIRLYLDLDKEDLKSRIEISKLLNQKFIEDKLRKGKEIKLDKKVSKLFGYKKGHVIKFNEYQTFIKNIYDNDEEISTNKVVINV